MSISQIIWILAGVMFGSIVTFSLCFFLMKRKKENKSIVTTEDTASATTSEQIEHIMRLQQDKYEKLLAEARAQCEELNDQLKASLKGDTAEVSQVQLDALNHIKKKAKELEEELEEAEEDLSDAKKKLGKKDAEINALQDSLLMEQKVSKKLHDDLESTKQELEKTISDLNLKVGALGFIQEVLDAKEINSADSSAIIKSVDQFESFIKGQYFDLKSFLHNAGYITWNGVSGQRGFDDKKDYFINSFDQWASTKKKSWLNNKTTIAFVGEFSAGKTSIVNRILSQDNPNVPRLPVSVEATTAIPTYIAGGQRESYNYITGEGKCKTILEGTFKKVSKQLFDQIKGISSLIKYFVMTYNNPNLNGLSILDTPGFNSNDKKDGDRTIEVVNECDALFWVVDVNIGELNRSSLPIIKEKLHKPLYIVISKVDTKAESDIKKVEEKIRRTLNDEGITVQQYIRFSTKMPLNVIMDPIKKVTKIAVRDTFAQDIDNDIQQIINIMDDMIKTKTAEYQTKYQEGENIKERFKASIRSLQRDCSTAQGIPQFKEGFKVFGIGTDDKYTMSIAQAHNLDSLLSTISKTHVQKLEAGFNNSSEKASEIQRAWSELCNLKNAWQKTNDCMQQFKRIQKTIS